MQLLLDTNALIWWTLDHPRLGPRARQTIGAVGNEVLFSPASPWEAVIKVATGKLHVDVAGMLRSAEAAGFRMVPFRAAHFETLGALDRRHGDPFDRMIVAQAITEGAMLMTSDRTLSHYPVRTVGCD